METKYSEDIAYYINELLWQKNYPIKENIFYIVFENLWKKLGGYECIKTENAYNITRIFLEDWSIRSIIKKFPKNTPLIGQPDREIHPKGSIHRFYDSVCNVLNEFEDSTRQIHAREIFEEEIYEFVKFSPLGILDDYDGFKTARAESDLDIKEDISMARLKSSFNSLEELFDEENSNILIEYYKKDDFFDKLTLELLKRKGYPIRFQYFNDILERILKKKGIKFDHEIFIGKFKYFLSKKNIKLNLEEDRLLSLDLGYPRRSIGYINLVSKMILRSFNVNDKNLDKIIEDSIMNSLIDCGEDIFDKLRL